MIEEKKSAGNSIHQLSVRMENLQNAFRKLSKSVTLKDLSNQFIGVLSGIYPDQTVQLACQVAGSQGWEWFASGSPDGEERLNGLLAKLSVSSFAVVTDSAGVCLLQRLADKSLIGLMIVPENTATAFTELDVVSFRIFVQLFDNAYQDIIFRKNEKGLVFSLNQRILQLNSLIETGIEVEKLDHNELPYQLALSRAVSLTNAARGIVRVKSGDSVTEEYTFPDGVVIDRPTDNTRQLASAFTFMSDTVTFELFEKESRSGIVPFEETDHLLLDALARQVHASMENRYLLKQALEKQRIEQEMSVAASIQQKILPSALPVMKGYDLAGINIPSKSVGGDYYDCIPLQNGTFALVIADVTGKGVPAALLVSSLHAYLLAYLEGSFGLSELASRLNKSLYRDSTEDKFVTAFIGIVDPVKGEIKCLSAGHNPAYILRKDGRVDEWNIGGPPLGIIDFDVPYQSATITLAKGERLLLYTDGVTEALNEKNELFEDYHSLPEYLSAHAADNAQTFIANLIADIRKFSGSAPQSDDITVLYFCRL